MSIRNAQIGSLVALLAFVTPSIAFAQAPVVPSAPPAAAPVAAPAPAGPTLNIFGVPTPKKGKPYRFNLCTGQQFDSTDISRVCNPTDAAATVSGAKAGVPIVFRLAATSFLPPGCGLDGNGVIGCAADADLSKLKSVRICAIQVGGFGSNFACTGQDVGFNKSNKVNIRKPQAPQPANAAKAGGGGAGTAVKVAVGVGGAVGAGIVLMKALDELKAAEAITASTSSFTTTTSPVATGSRFAGTYDFSYVSPLGPQNLNRYWTVRTDGSIVSSDGAVSGTVNDAGTVRFAAPCWTNSGGTATWNGTLAVGSVKSGSGTFTCALNNINGGTWRVDNGR